MSNNVEISLVRYGTLDLDRQQIYNSKCKPLNLRRWA